MKNQSKYCVALAVEYRPQKMEQNKNWENRPNSKVPKKKKKSRNINLILLLGSFLNKAKEVVLIDMAIYLSIYMFVCVYMFLI